MSTFQIQQQNQAAVLSSFAPFRNSRKIRLQPRLAHNIFYFHFHIGNQMGITSALLVESTNFSSTCREYKASYKIHQ